jgi:Leucyl-tRNA synthetase
MALLKLMSPFTPHIAEELWEHMGGEGLCCQQPWPEWDEHRMTESEKTIAVQVGGKLRATVTIPADADEETMIKAALADEKISRMMEGMELVRTITVKNKLVNLILKPKTLDKA